MYVHFAMNISKCIVFIVLFLLKLWFNNMTNVFCHKILTFNVVTYPSYNKKETFLDISIKDMKQCHFELSHNKKCLKHFKSCDTRQHLVSCHLKRIKKNQKKRVFGLMKNLKQQGPYKSYNIKPSSPWISIEMDRTLTLIFSNSVTTQDIMTKISAFLQLT